MSDPEAKRRRSKHKDARQMPAPDVKPKHRSKRKRHKPFLVETRFVKVVGSWSWLRGWSKHGAYETRELAMKIIRKLQRAHPDWYLYRITNKDTGQIEEVNDDN